MAALNLISLSLSFFPVYSVCVCISSTSEKRTNDVFTQRKCSTQQSFESEAHLLKKKIRYFSKWMTHKLQQPELLVYKTKLLLFYVKRVLQIWTSLSWHGRLASLMSQPIQINVVQIKSCLK